MSDVVWAARADGEAVANRLAVVVGRTGRKTMLEQAIAGDNDVPIAQLLRAAPCPITIFRSKA